MEKFMEYPSEEKIWKKKCLNAEISMPESDTNVYDYIYECNKDNLDDIAFIYDPLIDYPGNKITYREFFKMVDDCAKAYKNIGVNKGDIVTVCLPSFIEAIISFYALNKIGAIPNHIHPLASKEEIKFYLEEVNSKVFLSYDGNYDNFKDVVEELKIENVILVSSSDMLDTKTKLSYLFDNYKEEQLRYGNKVKLSEFIKKVIKEMKIDLPNDRYISYRDFIKNGKKYKDSIDTVYDSMQAASLTHTSGTTGKSKGVLSSAYGYNEMVRQIAKDTPILKRKDTELLVLPPYPIYVLCNNIHMCLARGISIIFVPKVDYKNIHKYFLKYDITAIQGIPSIINAMIKDKGFDDKNIDLSHIKFIVSGGGNMTLSEFNDTNKFLHNHGCKYNVTIGYGMSEMGSCSTCTFNDKIDSGIVGRPLSDTNIMIVDMVTKEELSYGEQGEIWLSGPCRMIGYYNNEDATNKIFEKRINKFGKEETWVKTGDIGLITKDGNLKYIGRDKRITMIVDPSSNTVSKISNDYVEDIIVGKYPSGEVSDCIVISVPSEEKLNKLKAYVLVKDAPYNKIVQEIDMKCGEVLREVAKPVEYIFVDDNIPYTKSGKKDFTLLEGIENGKLVNDGKVKIKKRILTKEI